MKNFGQKEARPRPEIRRLDLPVLYDKIALSEIVTATTRDRHPGTGPGAEARALI